MAVGGPLFHASVWRKHAYSQIESIESSLELSLILRATLALYVKKLDPIKLVNSSYVMVEEHCVYLPYWFLCTDNIWVRTTGKLCVICQLKLKFGLKFNWQIQIFNTLNDIFCEWSLKKYETLFWKFTQPRNRKTSSLEKLEWNAIN